jgi:hypothetical protein
VVWPIAAGAQQGDRIRRIGVLMGFSETDPEAKAYITGFTQRLSELGWTHGRNLRMDVSWTAGNVDRMGVLAKGRPTTRGDYRPHDPGDRCASAGDPGDPDCICERR